MQWIFAITRGADINSLIDNNILVNRYIINGFKSTGDVAANGYYLVDMFDTIFGVSENDKGMSGDITFRKQAFELMGALGYYEGFVPYVSNQYKNLIHFLKRYLYQYFLK